MTGRYHLAIARPSAEIEAMCSRYELNAPTKEITRYFQLPGPLWDLAGPEFRPTDSILVVAPGGVAARRIWGPPAPWDGKPLINARAETLLEKPTFRPYLGGRCLVPATAYFEWRAGADGKRHKNRIRSADSPLMAFAGLANATHAIILTTAPAAPIRHIHDRMPAILDGPQAARWLDPGVPMTAALPEIRPYDGALAFDEDRPRQGDLFG